MAIFYGLILVRENHLFIYESYYTWYIYIGLKPRHPGWRLKLDRNCAWSNLILTSFPPFFPPWLRKHEGSLPSNAELRWLQSYRLFHPQKVQKVFDSDMLKEKGLASFGWLITVSVYSNWLRVYLQIYSLTSHFSWHSHLASFSGTLSQGACEEATDRTSEEKIVKLEFSNISKNFAQKSCYSHPRIQVDGFFFYKFYIQNIVIVCKDEHIEWRITYT